MDLVPRDPFQVFLPFASFRRDFDDLFREFFREIQPALAGRGEGTLAPRADLVEGEAAFELSIELPGIGPDDVRVELTGDVLTIQGEKKEEKSEGRPEGKTYRRERRFSRFERSFTLPASVDPKKVAATLRDGVLSLTLPKSEQARARTIEVKVEGSPKAIDVKPEKPEKGEKKAA
jgi:HSP20 family protein